MSLIPNVVDGEASESDTEVELGRSPEIAPKAKGFVITGEAPESDDESKLPSHTDQSELDSPLHTSMFPPSSPTKMMQTSILHQKLWECNVSLRATLEGLMKHTIDISVEKLGKADKTLLSVQESMRSTNASLTLAKARLKQIHSEFENSNCGNVLPTVKLSHLSTTQ
ncbi:unnamed protein product [Leptidea sinapis]|uniref:Biogenesis of lysosome-related organelles complex 1 subunit 3 n=1 Tax=Leptidea sinapis TaxID=189913 RepID=A0A5E4QLL6_9NEOP|nr:unnamed protein product [Leptidea sinapis]